MLNSSKLGAARVGSAITVTTLGAECDFYEGRKYVVCAALDGSKYIKDDVGDTVCSKPQNDPTDGSYSIDIFQFLQFDVEPPAIVCSVVHENPIVITPNRNGSWTMQAGLSEIGVRPLDLGAFTAAEDMLVGLKDYLENGAD